MIDVGHRPGTARGEQVWLLGNTHPAADRSIGWRDRLPNLGDPDALIVDMTTLTEDAIREMGAGKLGQIRRYIEDKFLGGGGTIAVITAAEFSVPLQGLSPGRPIAPPPGGALAAPRARSNYSILPVVLDTVPVADGHRILYDELHNYKEYVDTVGHFEFYIAKYNRTIHSSLRGLEFFLDRVDLQDITDNSGHDLGFQLAAAAVRGDKLDWIEGTGYLVFLPPYTNAEADAIGTLLTYFGRGASRGEAPPPWAKKLSFTRANGIQAQIAGLEADASKIQDQIAKLDRQRAEIMAHRRLLYAKGAELESAVAGAFKTIGFAEARPMGKSDQADCAIDINTGGYLYGLVEAKGADGRTGERHISQCAKWVDKAREADGRPSKGIFVPNQHRRAEYPGSVEDRLWFEKKEIDYAKMRDICIIPSCALFEAAKKALDGEAPDRAEIAARIAGTKGMLECVF